jgi:hypothetical protein
MVRVGELLLLTAGVVVGAYGYLLHPPGTSTNVTEITWTPAAPDRDYHDGSVTPTFAPMAPLTHESVSDSASVGEASTVPPSKPATWTTVVLSGQPLLSPLKSSRSPDFETKAQLASDLQQELQRVGCYQGEITGSWNAPTRRAMSAFIDRANAVLPFNEPDYVLLALVRSHREVACTVDCPSGQIIAGGGRCLPRAIVAQAAKKSKRLEERRLAAARLAERRGRETVAQQQQPEVLPWLRPPSAAAPSQEIALAPRPDPLPGRMSIGGPPLDVALTSSAKTLPVSDEVMPHAPDAASPVIDAQAPTRAPKFAALQSDPDADALSDDGATATTGNVPLAVPDTAAVDHKSRKSRHSDRESRRRYDSYGYSERRRRGPPRPGTAQYNLMQSLGGVY